MNIQEQEQGEEIQQGDNKLQAESCNFLSYWIKIVFYKL